MTHVMVSDATGLIGSHLLGSPLTAAQTVRLLCATTSPVEVMTRVRTQQVVLSKDSL